MYVHYQQLIECQRLVQGRVTPAAGYVRYWISTSCVVCSCDVVGPDGGLVIVAFVRYSVFFRGALITREATKQRKEVHGMCVPVTLSVY